MSVLHIQPVSDDAILPTFDPKHGYLLYANEDAHLAPGEICKVKSSFCCSFPEHYCAIITKYSDLQTLGGLIDSDFRGDLQVIVISNTERFIKKGEIVAKMILLEIALPVIYDATNKLNDDSNDE